MFGSVARLRAKPGGARALVDFLNSAGTRPHGFLARYIYQLDDDPETFLAASVFASREAYVAYSREPETHATYLKLLTYLAEAPAWHDGELVAAETA